MVKLRWGHSGRGRREGVCAHTCSADVSFVASSSDKRSVEASTSKFRYLNRTAAWHARTQRTLSHGPEIGSDRIGSARSHGAVRTVLSTPHLDKAPAVHSASKGNSTECTRRVLR